MASRSYSARTLKLLWGRSAGRCAVPGCRIELFVDATDYDPVFVIGEIAHLAAVQDGGPRADPGLSAVGRNDYDNLILLCQNCHAVIDGQPGSYPIQRISAMKAAHELWVRNSLPERGRSLTGWTAISLQGGHPTDLTTVTAAISPDFIRGEIERIRIPSDPVDWDLVGNSVRERAAVLLSGADVFDFRLGIFPLAPVSACIALGYHLTNRPNVRCFQYDRDARSWAWSYGAIAAKDITVQGLDNADAEAKDVGFVFHLSAQVRLADVSIVSDSAARIVHLRVPNPSTTWLTHPQQLADLASVTRRCFEAARSQFPNAERWHIYFAGPAPAAVVVGQQINPTMSPLIQLYEYRAREQPPYETSIRLGED